MNINSLYLLFITINQTAPRACVRILKGGNPPRITIAAARMVLNLSRMGAETSKGRATTPAPRGLLRLGQSIFYILHLGFAMGFWFSILP